MSKYADLDGQILALLSDGPLNWNVINHRVNSHAQVMGNWRVVDGRLQALRRKGRITPGRLNGEAVWRLT